jgi:hypothetical protein
MSKSFWDHPIETIEKALHIRKQIEALQQNLREIYGDGRQPLFVENAPSAVAKGVRKRKKSAATLVKKAAAQQARWAKNSSPAVVKHVKKPKTKRVVSKASRARMSAGQRARRTKEKIAPELSMPNQLVF